MPTSHAVLAGAICEPGECTGLIVVLLVAAIAALLAMLCWVLAIAWFLQSRDVEPNLSWLAGLGAVTLLFVLQRTLAGAVLVGRVAPLLLWLGPVAAIVAYAERRRRDGE